jgi:hypothetical protein
MNTQFREHEMTNEEWMIADHRAEKIEWAIVAIIFTSILIIPTLLAIWNIANGNI